MEPYGSTMVDQVIVNEGKVVRPSQLIASVRATEGGRVMGPVLLALALSAVGSAQDLESVRYAAFRLEGTGRTLIAEGTRTYSPAADIQTSEHGRNSFLRLALFDPFELEVRFEKGFVDGFGLAILSRRNRDSFSFNWFERDQGDVFVKTRPKRSGRLRVLFKSGVPAAIEFLDDITLRFTDDLQSHRDDHTHEFVIARGSVLRVLGRAP